MKLYTLFFLILGIVFNSCSNSNENQLNKDFQKVIRRLNPEEVTKGYQAYLVIPNTGCTGCISSAESILLENYKKSKKVKFILTRIESFKNLYLKLKIDINNEPNIILDKDNLFSQEPFASIYPQVFFVDSLTGNIISKEEISPTGNGMLEINKRIFNK